ncbi:hypothetical protein [Phytoactinopolyspora mesophila]|uniref:Alkaline shock response membrane anchor protein AmaP n=1 Tax=Phytoactinopolyspora mesophila TaxID=2650750 RepID=A0A7K3MCX4_9ACTN|nr:hypothetical protein [Phytoactinopolyspora mesophila]NDL60907.1 hypothetical protein [Phytoactinopolyspora mesophila]
MRRPGAVLERTAVFAVGVVLMAAGAAAVAWELDWIPDAPDQLDVTVVAERTEAGWWPWAAGGAGVILVVVGLYWLFAHTRRRTIHRLELSGSDPGGRLTVDSSAVVESARATLEGAAGLQLRSGRIIDADHRERLVDLRVGIDPGADLGEAADAAERVAAELAANLGPDSAIRYRVILAGQGKKSKVSRVQ